MDDAGPQALVGNDIVDLDDPDSARELSSRFIARVCCARESRRLLAAAEGTRALWTLYAAKEAAYKLWMKARPIAFIPPLFEVSADLAFVSLGERRFALTILFGTDFVHACASTGRARPNFSVRRLRASEEPGARARAVLRELAARRFGVAPSEFEIVRRKRPGAWDGFAPPELYFRGRALPVDVSLSHHGRFVAAALGPTEDTSLPCSRELDALAVERPVDRDQLRAREPPALRAEGAAGC